MSAEFTGGVVGFRPQFEEVWRFNPIDRGVQYKLENVVIEAVDQIFPGEIERLCFSIPFEPNSLSSKLVAVADTCFLVHL